MMKTLMGTLIFFLGFTASSFAQQLPNVSDLSLNLIQVEDMHGNPIPGQFHTQVSFTLPGLDSLSWHQVDLQINSSGSSTPLAVKQMPIQGRNYYRDHVSYIRHGNKVHLDLGDLNMPVSGTQTLTAEISLVARENLGSTLASTTETVN